MTEREKSNQKKNKNGGLKAQSQKLKARILKSYYGNPLKDMKLIAITGTTGKTIVAHFVHEILKATGEQVAVLASDQPFKIGMLHKFLSDAWKAGANYVVVTVPAEGLRDNVFYGQALTDFMTEGSKLKSGAKIFPEQYKIMILLFNKLLEKFSEKRMNELHKTLEDLENAISEVVEFNI